MGLTAGDISTLNPALATDGNSLSSGAVIFSNLFRVDPATGLPLPNLATWEISPDGLSYTFTLKEGIVWSDGVPITSADVKFTYDAIMSDLVQSPRKADMAAIASFEIVDERTFIITLNAPNCSIWGSAFASLSPLPARKFAPDFSDFMTSEFNTAPDVGSGPYLFDERAPGEYLRLKANPLYYMGEPKIPALVFRIIADPATQNQAVETGAVDYAFMYPEDFSQIPDTSMVNIYTFALNNAPILMLNNQDPTDPQPAYDENGNLNELVPNKFFGDVRVRQAVAMGYDKSALAIVAGEGSEPLTGPITPMFYDTFDLSGIEPWPYDPERAKQLLEACRLGGYRR